LAQRAAIVVDEYLAGVGNHYDQVFSESEGRDLGTFGQRDGGGKFGQGRRRRGEADDKQRHNN